jgi:predicted tellurium resistance membrane protein TerC
MKHFRVSIIVTVLCLLGSAWWGYEHAGPMGALTAIGVAAILAVMEVSLSFDNAVVNASVLKTWDPFWKKLFLGVGIIIAVFGMRLLFPLVIVAVAADLGMMDVWNMALQNPKEYSMHLTNHHAEVAAFGGMFLLLVFLNFLFDDEKEHHWLGHFEAKLGSLGKVSSIAVMIAIGMLMASLTLVPEAQKMVVLISGLWGILIYVGVDVLSNMLEKSEEGGGDVGEMRLPVPGSAGCIVQLRRRDRRVRDHQRRRDHHAGPGHRRDVRAFADGLFGGKGYARPVRVPGTRRPLRDRHPGLDHVGQHEVPRARAGHRPGGRGLHRRLGVVVDPLPQEAGSLGRGRQGIGPRGIKQS